MLPCFYLFLFGIASILSKNFFQSSARCPRLRAADLFRKAGAKTRKLFSNSKSFLSKLISERFYHPYRSSCLVRQCHFLFKSGCKVKPNYIPFQTNQMCCYVKKCQSAYLQIVTTLIFLSRSYHRTAKNANFDLLRTLKQTIFIL